MAGAVVMVVVLLVVFPVIALMGFGVMAALLGSMLKGDADARNTESGKPNEYLALSDNEPNVGYPGG